MTENEIIYWWLAVIIVIAAISKTFTNKFYEKTDFEGKEFYFYEGDSKVIPVIYKFLM